MVNPHPKENKSISEHANTMTWLAYFVARCPITFNPSGTTWDEQLAKDCAVRIEWARAMLHALWPVKAQNSGNTP